jgi:hypothetical protein
MDELAQALARIDAHLERISNALQTLLDTATAPTIGLSVVRLSSTMASDDGHVVPGSMILAGEEASNFFRGLGHATVLPLNELPPWTHMALAQGSWWLLKMV